MANRCLEIREFTHTLKSLAQAMEQSMSYVDVGNEKFAIGVVKTAHLAWKVNLEAVLEGRKKISVESLPDHHTCAFGKWYDDVEGELTSNPLFKEIAVHHKAVHATVKEVIGLYNNDEAEAARTKMAAFEAARIELFRVLDELYAE